VISRDVALVFLSNQHWYPLMLTINTEECRVQILAKSHVKKVWGKKVID